jgi:hypothetical protein
MVFQLCFNGVSMVFKIVFQCKMMFQWCFNGGSMVFQWYLTWYLMMMMMIDDD